MLRCHRSSTAPYSDPSSSKKKKKVLKLSFKDIELPFSGSPPKILQQPRGGNVGVKPGAEHSFQASPVGCRNPRTCAILTAASQSASAAGSWQQELDPGIKSKSSDGRAGVPTDTLMAKILVLLLGLQERERNLLEILQGNKTGLRCERAGGSPEPRGKVEALEPRRQACRRTRTRPTSTVSSSF